MSILRAHHCRFLIVSQPRYEFDQFEVTGSSRKKAVWGTNFKPNGDIMLVLVWEDISLMVTEKYQSSTK